MTRKYQTSQNNANIDIVNMFDGPGEILLSVQINLECLASSYRTKPVEEWRIFQTFPSSPAS